MTLKIYMKAIGESKIESGTEPQILKSIFTAAGYFPRKDEGLAEATFAKWINGTRPYNGIRYFPEGKLGNPNGLFKFFRNRPENKLRELQRLLCEEKEDDSPIDYETEDLDRFCWSLVNQFLDLLCLERISMPDSDGVSGESSVDVAEKIGLLNPRILDTSDLDMSTDEKVVDSPEEENVGKGYSTIAFPDECRVCFCCKNWKDNSESDTLYGNIIDGQGECKVFGRQVSASDPSCNKFKENYNRAVRYESYKKFGIF